MDHGQTEGQVDGQAKSNMPAQFFQGWGHSQGQRYKVGIPRDIIATMQSETNQNTH